MEEVVEKPTEIPELIEWYSDKNGADKELAVKIARAESNFVPNARNPHSSASGVFQFINGTFKGFCIEKYQLTDSMEYKNDPDIQIDCATRMLSEGGVGHWSASQFLWDK